MPIERGFTIVEVVVAVVLVTVGLLGLTTTAGLVTRLVGQGARFTEVSALANQRMELFRATRCPPVGMGETLQGAFTVSWRVADLVPGRGRVIYVSVRSPSARGSRTDLFETVQACP